MTRIRQIGAAALALTLSGALHAAGLVRFATPQDVALQGGDLQAVPQLGDSFADLAAGGAVSAPAPAVTQPMTVAQPITPVPPVAQAAPQPPVSAAPVPDTSSIPPLDHPATAALAPAAPAPLAPTPQETALAPIEQTHAPEQSLRPQHRPDRPRPQVARAMPQSAGNADRNATRGAQSGQEQARATTAAAASAQPAAQGDGGRAASATYARTVLTQITRTRKERAPTRGRAVVAFAITDAGTLASVTVVQSSGSAALDQVAMDHIRRAAPFPQPPAGAQRQFSFEFVGRS
jgi:periplasmic protein TonB